MEPAIVVGLLWLLFGGMHIGLASRRIRAALVSRLGERGFELTFSLFASLSFAALVSYYARHRFAGIAGPGLGELPVARAVLSAMVVSGIALIPASLWAYPGSADAAMAGEDVRPARGIHRVTRHPFFTGVVLIALAHALLATRLVGSVFFAGFLLLATLGPWHQRTKRIALRGKPYADHVAGTSAIPFAAILAGRQPLAWREIPVTALAVGLGLAWLLSRLHGEIFAYGGLYVIVAFVGGAAILLALEWRRARHRAREPRWVRADTSESLARHERRGT